MSDDQTPFYAPNRKPSPPKPYQPGEKIWELRRKAGVFWHCELRDHGQWGIEAQLFRAGEFVASARFDTRAQAVQWAEIERLDLEGRRSVDA